MGDILIMTLLCLIFFFLITVYLSYAMFTVA